MNLVQAKSYFPPLQSKLKVANPLKLKYLLMAPPKWGKTTFYCGAPGAVLLAFEEGHGFINIPKVVITGWSKPLKDWSAQEDEEGTFFSTAMEFINALEIAAAAGELPYQFIIMDTIDEATRMASHYACEKAGVQHPSDGGDYGKGWDLLQTRPIRLFYNRIIKLGVGIGLTTHINEEWKKDQFKQDVFRRETTLPKGVQKFVHTQSDVIINGMFGRRRKGHMDRDRFISFDGTNEIMAGTRIRGIKVPVKYIVKPPVDAVGMDDLTVPWNQWANFFTNSPEAGLTAEAEYFSTYKQKNNEPVDGDEPDVPPPSKSAKAPTPAQAEVEPDPQDNPFGGDTEGETLKTPIKLKKVAVKK